MMRLCTRTAKSVSWIDEENTPHSKEMAARVVQIEGYSDGEGKDSDAGVLREEKTADREKSGAAYEHQAFPYYADHLIPPIRLI